MNKFYRVILSIAGVCFVLGVIICVVISATGGWNYLRNGFEYGNWAWNWNSNDYDNYDDNYGNYDDDENNYFYDESKSLSMKFDDKIESLDLSFTVSNVTIEKGNEFSLQVKGADKSEFNRIKVDGNTLEIKQKNYNGFWHWISFGFNQRAVEVIVTVPEGFNAEDFSLSLGVGDTNISDITTDYAHFDLGTGDINTNNFSADEITINCGVGDFDMKNAKLNDLTIDCGTGDVNIQGTVTGETDIDAGVGNVELNLDGNIDDYNFDIDSGVGDIRINGEKREGTKNENAPNSFDIDGGVGDITIDID